ncbi:MAG: hypothetical protein WBG48_00730 [Pricia sp.]
MKTKNLLDLEQLFEISSNRQETIELAPILEECMGETELLRELVFLYHQNALEFIGAAKLHLPNTDFKALGAVAHKVKAGLAMMRTDSLHAIIVLVQKECDGGQDVKHLQFLCDCFADEYPTVKTSIDVAMAKLLQK